jgi:thiol-disulfide isomerase/thioredoxin
MSRFSRRALAALALGALLAGCGDSGPVAVGSTAPDITGKDLDGNPLDLKDYRGKVVMLSFWASWCGPCRALLPHEKSLVERYQGKPFVLLGVNRDSQIWEGRKLVESGDVTWPSFWDGKEEIAKTYGVDALPFIFVIDHKGVVQFITRGISPEIEKKLDERIETLVREAEAAR